MTRRSLKNSGLTLEALLPDVHAGHPLGWSQRLPCTYETPELPPNPSQAYLWACSGNLA
jgi:hypothetical protein